MFEDVKHLSAKQHGPIPDQANRPSGTQGSAAKRRAPLRKLDVSQSNTNDVLDKLSEEEVNTYLSIVSDEECVSAMQSAANDRCNRVQDMCSYDGNNTAGSCGPGNCGYERAQIPIVKPNKKSSLSDTSTENVFKRSNVPEIEHEYQKLNPETMDHTYMKNRKTMHFEEPNVSIDQTSDTDHYQKLDKATMEPRQPIVTSTDSFVVPDWEEGCMQGTALDHPGQVVCRTKTNVHLDTSNIEAICQRTAQIVLQQFAMAGRSPTACYDNHNRTHSGQQGSENNEENTYP